MIKLINLVLKWFKQKYVIAGVPVIVQNKKKEILLGKRGKQIFYPNQWGLPGGMVEHGEPLKEAAIREVKEEMGINIKIIKKSSNVYEDFPKKECNLHLINIPFYAKIINGKPQPKDETKEVKWFKPEEIKKLKLAYNHNKILEEEGLI
jgi:mutator protein MutT